MDTFQGQVGREQLLLSLDIFQGLMTNTSTYFTQPPHAKTCSGFVFNEELGNLLSVKGRANIGSYTGDAGENITSLGRFYRGTSAPLIVYGTNKAKIRNMTDTGTDAGYTLAVTLTNDKVAEFEQWGDYLFFCNGTDAGQKIKSDGTVTRIGITAPSSTPSAAAGAAGSPDGTYNYRVTYQSATHESSPSSISAAVTVASQRVSLTNIPVSSDSQVTTVNIYRLGGTSTVWSYVGNVSNGTTTATDNVADADLGVELALNRDPPLVTCKQFIVHKNRMFGLTDTTIEPSNFNEPEGYNTGNSIKIDNSSSGDINLRMVSIGSLLFVGRRQSCYGIFGENAGEFIPKKLLDIGLVSPLSLVSDANILVGLFEDGIRSFDGSSWQIISTLVDDIFKNISRANRELMSGCIYNKTYYLSSSEEGKTWFFDLSTNEWGELPWGCSRVLSLTGDQDPETIIGVRTGQDHIDKWFQGGQDNGNNLAFDWKTDRIIVAKGHLFRGRELHILMDSASVAFTVTVTYDNTRVDTLAVTPSTNEYQVATLSDKAIGHDITIRINGSVTDNTKRLRIYKMWLYGWIERRRK